MKRQALLRFPPKQVFQLLGDPTTLEEFTPWKVTAPEPFGVGDSWTESRWGGLKRRRWTLVDYDRRGLSMAFEGAGIRVELAAKKGGPGSTNMTMRATDAGGGPAAVAKFEKSDGDRLDAMRDWLTD